MVFLGLAVDAWRHSREASEESLLSLSNPGHAIAAVGLALSAIGALAGLFATLLDPARPARDIIRGGVVATALTTALVAGAASSLVYIAASDVTVGHSHSGAAAALARADTGSLHDGHHDYGPHPTFAEFQSAPVADLVAGSPRGTVTEGDVPALRAELAAVSDVAGSLNTVEKAVAAGYDPASADVQGMGAHYLNMEYLSDGIFDPARPEGLLFSRVDGGPPRLVGIWFLQLPGSGGSTQAVAPEGFASSLDLWHGHDGICYVGLQAVAEGVSEAACRDQGGLYIGDQRWMLHVWVADGAENPDGVFAYLNRDLATRQVEALPLGQGEIITGLVTP